MFFSFDWAGIEQCW